MSQGKVFAIGDIHGCATELIELLDQLPLEADSTVVFLGDYVDRGPHSRQVIDTILDLKSRHHVVALLGNHEAMMLEFFKDPSSPLAGFFILNGGSATLASYVTEGNHYEVPKHHLAFLESLSVFYETESHFFVHAGVPNIHLKDIDPEKHRNELTWIRHTFLNSDFPWEKTIVHGHTPNTEIQQTERRINLDTGCVFNGHLTAMEVLSREVYQVRAKQEIPLTFLKENPQISRVAKRFLGEIPVYIETPEGYDLFSTVNYNEFGLLIVDTSGGDRIFEVGQILKGKIGDLTTEQISFTGEVVRHQKRNNDIAYGIKMLQPLSDQYIPS